MSKGIDRHLKGSRSETPAPAGCGALSQLLSHLQSCRAAYPSQPLEPLFEHLFNLAGEPIAVISEHGILLAANQAWAEFEPLLGPSRAETPPCYLALCRSALERSPGGLAAFEAGLKAVLSGELPEHRQEILLCPPPSAPATSVATPPASTALAGEAGEKPRHYQLKINALHGAAQPIAFVSHHDLTSLRQLEGDVRESHNLFHQVVENISTAVFLYDLEGRFAMVNNTAAEGFGRSARDLIGRSLFDVYTPEMAQTTQEQNLLVLTTGQTLSFELMLETPRGLRNLHVSKSVYRNHRSEIVGVLGIARDVTDRHQVIEALEKSERHFRALIENGGDRVGLLDGNAKIIYASPSTKHILGYEMEELVGTDAFLWVHPQDRPVARRRFIELMEHPNRVVNAQYRVLHKSGEWKWMEANGANRLHEPAIAAIVLNERDINERKKVEAELVGFSQIIESSNDAILATNLDGLITSWNPAAQRIFGYSEREALGRPASELVATGGRRQHTQLQQTALRGKGVTDYELQMLHKTGRRISVSLSISPLRNESRVITGCAKIIRDITERRRMEREIIEISDREKQRLGQDLHDDLCQHLVGISLVSNILAEQLEKQAEPKALASEARNIAALARHAVDHARSLARGLSPLRLEENGLIPQMSLLVSVTERLFRVPCSFEGDLPLQVRNLPAATHFYRILQEALHNAVKHSQATHVAVRLAAEGPHLILTIADDGVGMGNAETLSDGPEDSGGLGMHTMQYRAHVIGATLEFSETPGGGTQITCSVPRRKLGC